MSTEFDNWPAGTDPTPTPAPQPNPQPPPKPQELPWTAIAIGIAILVFMWNRDAEPKPGPSPTPAPTPTDGTLTSLDPILVGRDKATLAATENLYMAMAETIERAPQVNRSIATEQIQLWLTDSNTLRFAATDYVGKLPGFTQAVNAAAVEAIGLQSRTASEQDIKALARLCRQVAASAAAASKD